MFGESQYPEIVEAAVRDWCDRARDGSKWCREVLDPRCPPEIPNKVEAVEAQCQLPHAQS